MRAAPEPNTRGGVSLQYWAIVQAAVARQRYQLPLISTLHSSSTKLRPTSSNTISRSPRGLPKPQAFHLFHPLHPLHTSDSSEEGLKHDNSTLLAEHTQKQSQYMANAGLQLGATHLDAETLENVDINEVNAALHQPLRYIRYIP